MNHTKNDLTTDEKKKVILHMLLMEEFPINADAPERKNFLIILKNIEIELNRIHKKYRKILDRDHPYWGYLFEIFNVVPDWAMKCHYKRMIFKNI